MKKNKENSNGTMPEKMNTNTNQPSPGASSNNNHTKKGEPPRGPRMPNVIFMIILVTFLLNFIVADRLTETATQIEYSQFIKLVEKKSVSHVQISDEKIEATIAKKADLNQVESILATGQKNNQVKQAPTAGTVYTAVRVEDPKLIDRLTTYDIPFSNTTSPSSSPVMGFVAMWIIPALFMYLFYTFIMRKMLNKSGENGGSGLSNLFGAGKSKAKEYNLEKSTGVKFTDVAGQDEAKESLAEMVDYLHNPEKYKEIGAKQPKGALLVGPPGTGKTLLAKAVAGEAGVPFYSISGSEFVEMFVGVGASRVRDLFQQAKKNEPCIIFIDEIDAIGKSRDHQMGSNDEREQTLNQLLAEMDGFEDGKGIIILAATNRPEVLDKALLRPGRFDRRIIVEKPDLIGREAILQVHGKKVTLDSSVNLHDIALATSGATGADLANMVNEGALLAVKENRKTVRQQDLMEAVEIVIAGKEKKDRVMNQTERDMVAYHEVGHALVSALQKNSQPVQKITIIPRTMGSLGYTMNMPEEERYLLTKDEMLAQITTLLGGRAAEIIKFGQVTTGASNDIERATKLAREMVTQYGMSDKFGPMGLEVQGNQYLDGKNAVNCSQETETIIDEEVRSILSNCQENAITLLEENQTPLHRIAAYLLDKENITGEVFMELLNKEQTSRQGG